jgi:tetratricopeptide (TPR) repeat protein
MHGEAGDEEKALAVMNEVLERDPDHASALNYVGYTWAEQGERLDEAENMIRRAIDLRPDDGYIADSLGWVLYQRGLKLLAAGREPDAREAFSAAIEQLERASELLDRGDPIITRHLGDAYRSVLRFDDALAAYRRALDLDPEEEDAEEIRGAIELLEIELEGSPPGARH